jgi:phage terminase large subunit-like protein
VTTSRFPARATRTALKLYLGIDPAISIADGADDFAMALIGVDPVNAQVYLVDYFLGHIAFPDQLDKIQEWFLKWRPELIGVESNAYQRALEQQVARMAGFPSTVPVFSKGKKEERILRMAPLFKVGKCRIRKNQAEFIDQWVSFDPEKKNQKDDLLDAVEIAPGRLRRGPRPTAPRPRPAHRSRKRRQASDNEYNVPRHPGRERLERRKVTTVAIEQRPPRRAPQAVAWARPGSRTAGRTSRSRAASARRSSAA